MTQRRLAVWPALAAAALMLALCAPALAGSALDVEALRANLVRWVASREGKAPADVAGRIAVQRVVPVSGAPLDLFAVRLSILPPPGVQGVPSVAPILVDATGAYRFGAIYDLGRGTVAGSAAMEEAMRFELPADFGTPLASLGGPRDLVLVSDPFCPHCRNIWKALMDSRQAVGSLRLATLPLVGREGARAVGWAVAWAADHGQDALAVAEYAMTSLERPGGGLFEGRDAALGALADLSARFPDLGLGAPEQALETLRAAYEGASARDGGLAWAMGLDAVPAVFVDGLLLKGDDPDRLLRVLRR